MKCLLSASLLLGLSLASPAEDTAYSALRVIGRSQGHDVLNHVLEARGRAGSPQPAVWKITLDEPRARGGIREVEVQHGKIIGERTPSTSPVTGSPMNFTQLNLDSEGAFTVANQEAQKAAAPFDHVDYLLRSGTGGGVPVWHLDLTDSKLGRAGSIEIAADSGAILRSDFSPGKRRAPEDDRAYVNDHHDPGPPPQRPRSPDDGYSQPGEPFRSPADFFHRLGKRFERRGQQLENFFTGKGAQADRERYREDQ